MSYLEIGIILTSLAGLLTSVFAYRNRTSVVVKPNNPLDHIAGMYILKMPYERIVIGYFGITLLAYAILPFTSGSINETWHIVGLLLASSAFLLFLYKLGMSLTSHVTFNIATLLYAILNALIAWLIYQKLDNPIQTLTNISEYTLTMHLLGMVFGAGGTFILDLLIFHFLWNYKINKQEAVIMHLISQLIIIGLIFIIISGITLYLTDQQTYLSSSRFLMKMTAVFALTVNGLVLNFSVMPEIEKLSMEAENQKKNQSLKRRAFGVGAVSMISWLTAFLFAMIKDLDQSSYLSMFIPYLILLAIGISLSQIMKSRMENAVFAEENTK